MGIGKYLADWFTPKTSSDDSVNETRARPTESRRFSDIRSRVLAEIKTDSGVSAMARLYLKENPEKVREKQKKGKSLDVSILEVTQFIDGNKHQVYNVSEEVRQETADKLKQRYGVDTIWEDTNDIICSAGNKRWLMYREGFAIGTQ